MIYESEEDWNKRAREELGAAPKTLTREEFEDFWQVPVAANVPITFGNIDTGEVRYRVKRYTVSTGVEKKPNTRTTRAVPQVSMTTLCSVPLPRAGSGIALAGSSFRPRNYTAGPKKVRRQRQGWGDAEVGTEGQDPPGNAERTTPASMAASRRESHCQPPRTR